MKDHVVIIGFGDGGKTIAKVVRMAKIPALAIDSDPEVVLASKKRKTLEVIFGNATTNKVLEHANIKEARLIVITLTKFDLILSIISAIRKIDTKVHIISTTRRTRDLIKLFDAGANDVISEQFETSMELVTRILGRYLVPRDEIDGFIDNVRKLNYDMTRSIRYEQQGLQDYRLEINNTEIATIKIRSDGPFVGKNLMQLDFRNKWKVNVLAIKRGEEVFTNPQPDMILALADLLIVFGEHKDVDLIIRR
jgi:CPA2 family monovalent cation:H+ antiporter-2